MLFIEMKRKEKDLIAMRCDAKRVYNLVFFPAFICFVRLICQCLITREKKVEKTHFRSFKIFHYFN